MKDVQIHPVKNNISVILQLCFRNRKILVKYQEKYTLLFPKKSAESQGSLLEQVLSTVHPAINCI